MYVSLSILCISIFIFLVHNLNFFLYFLELRKEKILKLKNSEVLKDYTIFQIKRKEKKESVSSLNYSSVLFNSCINSIYICNFHLFTPCQK